MECLSIQSSNSIVCFVCITLRGKYCLLERTAANVKHRTFPQIKVRVILLIQAALSQNSRHGNEDPDSHIGHLATAANNTALFPVSRGTFLS